MERREGGCHGKRKRVFVDRIDDRSLLSSDEHELFRVLDGLTTSLRARFHAGLGVVTDGRRQDSFADDNVVLLKIPTP